MKSLLLAVALAASLQCLVASEASGVLLKAKSVTEKDRVIRAIDATAIIGNLQISAAEMTFDKERKTLACAGEATIRSNGTTMRAKNATIDIGGRRVFLLSPSGITVSPEANFVLKKEP